MPMTAATNLRRLHLELARAQGRWNDAELAERRSPARIRTCRRAVLARMRELERLEGGPYWARSIASLEAMLAAHA